MTARQSQRVSTPRCSTFWSNYRSSTVTSATCATSSATSWSTNRRLIQTLDNRINSRSGACPLFTGQLPSGEDLGRGARSKIPHRRSHFPICGALRDDRVVKFVSELFERIAHCCAASPPRSLLAVERRKKPPEPDGPSGGKSDALGWRRAQTGSQPKVYHWSRAQLCLLTSTCPNFPTAGRCSPPGCTWLCCAKRAARA